MLLSWPGKHAQAEAVGVLPRVALCGVLALSCVLWAPSGWVDPPSLPLLLRPLEEAWLPSGRWSSALSPAAGGVVNTNIQPGPQAQLRVFLHSAC